MDVSTKIDVSSFRWLGLGMKATSGARYFSLSADYREKLISSSFYKVLKIIQTYSNARSDYYINN